MIIQLSPEQGNLCKVPPHWGLFRKSQLKPDIPGGWALVLLSAAVLALAGCGRKAGLDLPPNASPQAAAAAQANADHEPSAKGNLFDPSYGTGSGTDRPERPQATLHSRPAAERLSRQIVLGIRYGFAASAHFRMPNTRTSLPAFIFC